MHVLHRIKLSDDTKWTQIYTEHFDRTGAEGSSPNCFRNLLTLASPKKYVYHVASAPQPTTDETKRSFLIVDELRLISSRTSFRYHFASARLVRGQPIETEPEEQYWGPIQDCT